MFMRLKIAVSWSPMLAALILIGCSTIKFAYSNVDWLLLSKADHYLDLTDAQRERAEQLLTARMEVHRREELPIYVATLKEIRVMLANNLSPAELEIITEQIPALYRRTMRDTMHVTGRGSNGLRIFCTVTWDCRGHDRFVALDHSDSVLQ